MSLAGRPMVAWSLDALRACEAVGSVVVACPPGREPDLGADVEAVDGGATRAQSVARALEAVGTELVAIHDAARPLVTPALVEAIVADLEADAGAAGCIAAAPVVDTVKRVGAAGAAAKGELFPHTDQNSPLVVEGTLDRSALWAAQTPQAFRTEALREALESAADPDAATDEAMLVEAAGGRVLIHPVAEPNLKVTTPLDRRLAELLLADRR